MVFAVGYNWHKPPLYALSYGVNEHSLWDSLWFILEIFLRQLNAGHRWLADECFNSITETSFTNLINNSDNSSPLQYGAWRSCWQNEANNLTLLIMPEVTFSSGTRHCFQRRQRNIDVNSISLLFYRRCSTSINQRCINVLSTFNQRWIYDINVISTSWK